jgi:hypothetical protein
VRDRKDAVAEAMQERANPAEVLSALEASMDTGHAAPETADEPSDESPPPPGPGGHRTP